MFDGFNWGGQLNRGNMLDGFIRGGQLNWSDLF